MKSRAELVALDKKYVWHPYTPMEEYVASGEPLVIERAEGSRIHDVDGRSFIDGNSSWWTALLGHNHPRLVNALIEQTKSFCHVALAGITHEPAVELAARLVERAPRGLEHVFYSDNGSTAVEAGIKLAVQFWAQNGHPRKSKFLSLEGAFHGETLGVTALGHVSVIRGPFSDVTMATTHLPSPALDEARALEALEREIVRQKDSLAALVLEPLVQGVGGMRIYSPEYLKAARRLTEQHDVLLILDEVFTGYGRTGRFWACDHAGISPDILASAKGFSGGMLPFAVTLTNDRVFEGFFGDTSRAFLYGHTYCGNPLGARVALEVLAIYDDEKIVEGVASRAARLKRSFDALAAVPGVESTRTLGMVGALDLSGGEGYTQRGGWRVFEAALRRGVYMRPLGNVVYLAPPLNISETDLEELCGVLEASVREALDA